MDANLPTLNPTARIRFSGEGCFLEWQPLFLATLGKGKSIFERALDLGSLNPSEL